MISCAAIVVVSPVPSTAPSASRRVPSTSTACTWSTPTTRTGRVQKCRKMRRSAPPAPRAAKSFSTARLRAATLSRPTTAGAGFVQLEILGIDDHVDPGDLSEFAEFLGGEGGVGGPAAAQHVDLGDLLRRQGRQHLLGHVRVGQLVHVLDQDPGHVEGHVAHAHDDGGVGSRNQIRELLVLAMIIKLIRAPRSGSGRCRGGRRDDRSTRPRSRRRRYSRAGPHRRSRAACRCRRRRRRSRRRSARAVPPH